MLLAKAGFQPKHYFQSWCVALCVGGTSVALCAGGTSARLCELFVVVIAYVAL